MQEKVEGIILSVTPYKESSKIINLYTKKYGLIGLIAKGASGIKSKLRAYTNNYTYGYFYIYYKENKLSLVTQIDLIDSFSNIKEDITLISYMSYLCDLTKQVIKDNNNSLIYDNLINSIKKINDGLDPLIITNIFEIKILDYLGVGLNLDSCVTCGSKNNIITLSSSKGGFICDKCYKDEYIVNPKTIKMIRMYYYVDINSISKIDVSLEVKNEINNFITGYIDSYTGIYLKSKEFLNSLINS